MRRIRETAERLAQQAADAAHIAALGLMVTTTAHAGSALGQSGDSDKDTTNEQSMTTPDTSAGTPLADALTERKQAFLKRAAPETADLYDRGVEQVDELNLTASALNIGDSAPAFELPNATGDTTALTQLLEAGPVVVTFYRGGWCPYCNIQLRAYQQRLSEIQTLGASLVAISPEVPDESLSTREKNALGFHVLSDAGNAVADAFGVRYRLPDELVDAFSGRFDLEQYNGDGSWTLPLAATYVIDREGVIRWTYLSADYRERAEPQAIIDALSALNEDG
ncbi:MAG: peroxiredoxin-like family protein [Planctomycetota bacterium]